MSPLGMIHTFFAVLALVAGLAIFIAAKGTTLHRIFGYIYVVSMLILNVTALMIYRLFDGFGPFHAFAIASLITLVAGFVPVYTKMPKKIWLDLHYEFILWSYVGLVAAGASELLTRAPAIHDSGVAFGVAVFVASALIIGIGAFFIRRRRQVVMSYVLEMLKARSR